MSSGTWTNACSRAQSASRSTGSQLAHLDAGCRGRRRLGAAATAAAADRRSSTWLTSGLTVETTTRHQRAADGEQHRGRDQPAQVGPQVAEQPPEHAHAPDASTDGVAADGPASARGQIDAAEEVGDLGRPPSRARRSRASRCARCSCRTACAACPRPPWPGRWRPSPRASARSRSRASSTSTTRGPGRHERASGRRRTGARGAPRRTPRPRRGVSRTMRSATMRKPSSSMRARIRPGDACARRRPA